MQLLQCLPAAATFKLIPGAHKLQHVNIKRQVNSAVDAGMGFLRRVRIGGALTDSAAECVDRLPRLDTRGRFSQTHL